MRGLVRNVHQVRAGQGLEHLHHDVRRRATARGAVVEVSWPRTCKLDELLQRRRGHGRMHEEKERQIPTRLIGANDRSASNPGFV